MGNVCGRNDKFSDTFPTDKESFDERSFSDFDDDLMFTNFAQGNLDYVDQMNTRASSFRIHPRHAESIPLTLQTPKSMPGLDSRRTHVERFFQEEEEHDFGFTLLSQTPIPTTNTCVDSDSKSNFSPISFEDFHSLKSQFTESDDDSTPPPREDGMYDMTNWIWKPEEDKIRRNTHQGTPTLNRNTLATSLWNPFGRQPLITPMVFERNSPPEIPRLSRRF